MILLRIVTILWYSFTIKINTSTNIFGEPRLGLGCHLFFSKFLCCQVWERITLKDLNRSERSWRPPETLVFYVDLQWFQMKNKPGATMENHGMPRICCWNGSILAAVLMDDEQIRKKTWCHFPCWNSGANEQQGWGLCEPTRSASCFLLSMWC